MCEESGKEFLTLPVPFGFMFCLAIWRFAMRLRVGLAVIPACAEQYVLTCSFCKQDGSRCGKPLDPGGNHALCCGCEGNFISRHDYVVRILARALKQMGCIVKTEQWCPELFDHVKKMHARMDLVVFVPWLGRTFYLDVSITHCVSGKGTINEGGKLINAQIGKHDRYRTVIDGVPVTSARLISIALSSLGGVGPEARSFFSMVGRGSHEVEEGTGQRGCAALVGLCSFAATMQAAGNCMMAYAPPRLHRREAQAADV